MRVRSLSDRVPPEHFEHCAEVAGRKAVFGKIDTIHVLERGSDDQVRHEIQRQMAAGKRNSGRFVVSVGSPATPRTPLSRLRAFFDLVHELGCPSRRAAMHDAAHPLHHLI